MSKRKRRNTTQAGRKRTDHPRRCKGTSRRTGKRCQQWARKGRDFCKFHGGNVPATAGSIYAKYVGFLHDKFAEVLTSVELKSLKEEVALSKALLMSYLENLGKQEVKAAEANSIMALCEHIGKMVERLDRVEQGLRLTISVEEMNAINLRIKQVLLEELKHHPDALRRIVDRLKGLAVGTVENEDDKK